MQGTSPLKSEDRVDYDGLLARRANRDEVHRAFEQGFNALDKCLGRQRQVIEGAHLGRWRLPAGQFFVNRLDALEGRFTRWEGGDHLAIELVARADFDALEVVEDIEASERDCREAVEPHAVPSRDGIEPADAAGAAGGRAVFAAAIFLAVVTERGRCVIEQFRWERAV